MEIFVVNTEASIISVCSQVIEGCKDNRFGLGKKKNLILSFLSAKHQLNVFTNHGF